MGFTSTIDLAPLAHNLSLPLGQVESVVRLLDAGNTIPFITRYRKDQTGGLDEEQIRRIQEHVGRLRMLVERKQTILRSIDSQGKLTPELAAAIESSDSIKRLEDLYLPYKPKKQSLATLRASGSWNRWPKRFCRRIRRRRIWIHGRPILLTPIVAWPTWPTCYWAWGIFWRRISASGPICAGSCGRSSKRRVGL